MLIEIIICNFIYFVYFPYKILIDIRLKIAFFSTYLSKYLIVVSKKQIWFFF